MWGEKYKASFDIAEFNKYFHIHKINEFSILFYFKITEDSNRHIDIIGQNIFQQFTEIPCIMNSFITELL